MMRFSELIERIRGRVEVSDLRAGGMRRFWEFVRIRGG